MTRNSLNFWIDIALLVAMAALIATGAIMQFLLPPGSGHFLMIFGMSRHGFGQIHAWLSVATVALIVVHIVLHWEWVCCLVGRSCGDPRPCRRTRVIWGASVLLLFVLLIGGGLWWASKYVTSVPGYEERRGRFNMESAAPEREPARVRRGRNRP